jgi:hypothetical protein
MRLRRTQFTLRRLMAAVAVAGLVFGCLAWIWRRLALDFYIHDTFIMVGPYVFGSDSAAFWAILLLVLALLMGLLVGVLASVVYTAKAIRNRIMRKARSGGPSS